jgi:transposase InsO family protein
MDPGPNTSRKHPEHKVYPYLLRGVPIVRPNQVWSTDITYIRLAHGFVYRVAIIDWHSRRVLSWLRISRNVTAGGMLHGYWQTVPQSVTLFVKSRSRGGETSVMVA